MFATGRVPNTDGLGLESAGVELDDKGAVVVDDDNSSTSKASTRSATSPTACS